MSRQRLIEECREAIEAERRATEQRHLEDVAWCKHPLPHYKQRAMYIPQKLTWHTTDEKKLAIESTRAEAKKRIVAERLASKTAVAQKLVAGVERPVANTFASQKSIKPSTATQNHVDSKPEPIQTVEKTVTRPAGGTKQAACNTCAAVTPTKSGATNKTITVKSETTSPPSLSKLSQSISASHV
jgi:hypothetical protein